MSPSMTVIEAVEPTSILPAAARSVLVVTDVYGKDERAAVVDNRTLVVGKLEKLFGYL